MGASGFKTTATWDSVAITGITDITPPSIEAEIVDDTDYDVDTVIGVASKTSNATQLATGVVRAGDVTITATGVTVEATAGGSASLSDKVGESATLVIEFASGATRTMTAILKSVALAGSGKLVSTIVFAVSGNVAYSDS